MEVTFSRTICPLFLTANEGGSLPQLTVPTATGLGFFWPRERNGGRSAQWLPVSETWQQKGLWRRGIPEPRGQGTAEQPAGWGRGRKPGHCLFLPTPILTNRMPHTPTAPQFGFPDCRKGGFRTQEGRPASHSSQHCSVKTGRPERAVGLKTFFLCLPFSILGGRGRI